MAAEGIRAVCRVQSAKLRRSLERTLRAGGYDLLKGDVDADVDLLFIDQESRQELGEDELSAMMAPGGSVVILGESLEDVRSIVGVALRQLLPRLLVCVEICLGLVGVTAREVTQRRAELARAWDPEPHGVTSLSPFPRPAAHAQTGPQGVGARSHV